MMLQNIPRESEDEVGGGSERVGGKEKQRAGEMGRREGVGR